MISISVNININISIRIPNEFRVNISMRVSHNSGINIGQDSAQDQLKVSQVMREVLEAFWAQLERIAPKNNLKLLNYLVSLSIVPGWPSSYPAFQLSGLALWLSRYPGWLSYRY